MSCLDLKACSLKMTTDEPLGSKKGTPHIFCIITLCDTELKYRSPYFYQEEDRKA